MRLCERERERRHILVKNVIFFTVSDIILKCLRCNLSAPVRHFRKQAWIEIVLLWIHTHNCIAARRWEICTSTTKQRGAKRERGWWYFTTTAKIRAEAKASPIMANLKYKVVTNVLPHFDANKRRLTNTNVSTMSNGCKFLIYYSLGFANKK